MPIERERERTKTRSFSSKRALHVATFYGGGLDRVRCSRTKDSTAIHVHRSIGKMWGVAKVENVETTGAWGNPARPVTNDQTREAKTPLVT